MSDLILESLEIQRFRAFQHLTIGHLGRVNLIVGKNNVGKSSLLEALRFYAQRASPIAIRQILGTHDETRRIRAIKNSGVEDTLSSVKYLFHGRKEIKAPMEPIIIGPMNSAQGRLFVSLHYSVQQDLWSLIFRLARRLNVQVFATSHSWDCIENFQQAAQKDEREEGVLIRLENKGGEVHAIVFDEQQLAIATREQIEVR